MTTMTPEALQAYIRIFQVLFTAGLTTVGQVRTWLHAIHGAAMSESDLNLICDGIIAEATRRADLAHRAAGEQ